MCKYDDYQEGRFDPNHPANQIDCEISLTIEELIESGETEKAISELNEIRVVVSRLREISKTMDNRYFINRLTEIYNKL